MCGARALSVVCAPWLFPPGEVGFGGKFVRVTIGKSVASISWWRAAVSERGGRRLRGSAVRVLVALLGAADHGRASFAVAHQLDGVRVTRAK